MFKFTDYIITPKDMLQGVKYICARTTHRDIIGIGLLAVAGIIMYLYASLSGETVFFWLFIVAMTYWNLDARIAIAAALAGLAAIPVLLLLFQHELMLTGEYWAERVAVWVYFFLVIGVGKQVVDMVRTKRPRKKQTIVRSSLPKYTTKYNKKKRSTKPQKVSDIL